MSPLSVPDCKLVCPSCPNGPDGRPPVVAFHRSQEQVRCPTCRRWLRVVTRDLAAPTQQIPLAEEGRSRYRVTTAEADGRMLQRTFTGSPGLRLALGARASFVYQSGRLVGIANQTTGTWFSLPAPRSPRGARSLDLALLALTAALALILAAHVLAELASRPAVALAALVVLVSLAVPWVLGLLSADGGDPVDDSGSAGQKGYVRGP